MANEEFKKVIDILGNFGEKLEVDAIASLKKFGHTDDGGQSRLAGSFNWKVKRQSNGNITFFFYMDKYGDYIDTGTKPATKKGGGGGMAESLENWIQGKAKLRSGVQRLQNQFMAYKNGKKIGFRDRKTPLTYDEAKKSLSYLIKRSIHKKGIIKRFRYKGSGFFTSLLKDGRIQKFEEALAKELGTEVKIIITNGLIKGKI